MARQCRLASPGVLMRLGLAVVFFSVSISWKVAALDEPVANSCSDPSYSWAYNSQGQSPCQVASEVMQPCACSLCNGQSPHSFGLYFNDAQCGTQYSSPPSDGPDIPSWASIQLINDDTFDVAAAKQEAGGAQPSNSASTDGHAALPSTRSPSPHSSDTPDRSPTNPGGSPTPSPSQSSSAAQSSMPSPPTDVCNCWPTIGTSTCCPRSVWPVTSPTDGSTLHHWLPAVFTIWGWLSQYRGPCTTEHVATTNLRLDTVCQRRLSEPHGCYHRWCRS
ncbi:hypothetical protein C8Q73DRAFT_504618 [Cubamyces lactineus]|nr:hypothetical protein C8Q73DRAFT_504618 [Cubamyces lactineus]